MRRRSLRSLVVMLGFLLALVLAVKQLVLPPQHSLFSLSLFSSSATADGGASHPILSTANDTVCSGSRCLSGMDRTAGHGGFLVPSVQTSR